MSYGAVLYLVDIYIYIYIAPIHTYIAFDDTSAAENGRHRYI